MRPCRQVTSTFCRQYKQGNTGISSPGPIPVTSQRGSNVNKKVKLYVKLTTTVDRYCTSCQKWSTIWFCGFVCNVPIRKRQALAIAKNILCQTLERVNIQCTCIKFSTPYSEINMTITQRYHKHKTNDNLNLQRGN